MYLANSIIFMCFFTFEQCFYKAVNVFASTKSGLNLENINLYAQLETDTSCGNYLF